LLKTAPLRDNLSLFLLSLLPGFLLVEKPLALHVKLLLPHLGFDLDALLLHDGLALILLSAGLGNQVRLLLGLLRPHPLRDGTLL
jgi:hypothetical protein